MAKGKNDGGILVPPIEQDDLTKRNADAEVSALFDKNETTIDELEFKKAEGEGLATEKVAFEIPAGKYKAGEEFELGKQLQVIPDEHEARIQKLVIERVAILGAQLREELSSIASVQANGISARMLGGDFDCPACGQRLIPPARTAQSKGLYEHPFTGFVDSGKKECEFKGVKFKSPVLFLEFAKSRPLTPKE